MNKKHRAAFKTFFVPFVAAAVLFNAALPPAAARAQSPERPAPDLASFVNPFVGTGNSPLPDHLGGNGSGNTFPGATTPFGMVQFGPDTDKSFGPNDRGS
jgi:putative alpha-1,2-mannosidase